MITDLDRQSSLGGAVTLLTDRYAVWRVGDAEYRPRAQWYSAPLLLWMLGNRSEPEHGVKLVHAIAESNGVELHELVYQAPFGDGEWAFLESIAKTGELFLV
jgi:hypothetical protein